MLLRHQLLGLALAGCPTAPGLVPDAEDVDECDPVCLTVQPGREGRLISDRSGELFAGLPDSGRICVEGLDVGAHQLEWVTDEGAWRASIRVQPFGWRLGRRVSDVPSPDLPPLALVAADPDPALDIDPDGWDADAIMAPAHVVHRGEELLFYAGTAEEHFAIGLARRTDPDRPLRRDPSAPLLSPGPPGATPGWKSWAQNTPEPEIVGDELWLYYNGQAEADGRLSIGLARGPDVDHLVDIGSNPVLAGTGTPADWDGRGVAHPSVVQRDGLFELWYASGTTFAIGYALSDDGETFERYCHNPVFQGLGTWDLAHVKAPEVLYDAPADRYLMSWSGCDKGCYQIGLAASPDGLRWTAYPEPLIPAGLTDHSALATREGYLERTADGAAIWCTANDGEHERIGRADLRFTGN